MGAKFELHGMRIKIGLLLEIGLIVFAHIVVDQGDRHDQWDQLIAVIFEYFEKLLLFIGRQLFFEISHEMLQHIGVLPDGCFQSQGFHQQLLILRIQVVDRQFLAACDELSHQPIVFLAVR